MGLTGETGILEAGQLASSDPNIGVLIAAVVRAIRDGRTLMLGRAIWDAGGARSVPVA